MARNSGREPVFWQHLIFVHLALCANARKSIQKSSGAETTRLAWIGQLMPTHTQGGWSIVGWSWSFPSTTGSGQKRIVDIEFVGLAKLQQSCLGLQLVDIEFVRWVGQSATILLGVAKTHRPKHMQLNHHGPLSWHSVALFRHNCLHFCSTQSFAFVFARVNMCCPMCIFIPSCSFHFVFVSFLHVVALFVPCSFSMWFSICSSSCCLPFAMCWM